jgi:hypothetical protein
MDFLFSGFIEFKNKNGDPVYIDASKIVTIEQYNYDENQCHILLHGIDGIMPIPMSAAELRRKISEIRARGQKTLRTLLK